MTVVNHARHITDTVTALSIVLKRKNEAGVLAAIDLNNPVYTVKFKMIDHNGTVIIAAVVATIDSASLGKVSYDFSSAGVLTAGTYYGYFILYNVGLETDHFPVVEKELKITLYGD